MGHEEFTHANIHQGLFMCQLIKSPEVETIIQTIFQMRKQRHREVKAFAWRHTANKWQSRGPHPGETPEVLILFFCFVFWLHTQHARS